jgi:hypothetical protein
MRVRTFIACLAAVCVGGCLAVPTGERVLNDALAERVGPGGAVEARLVRQTIQKADLVFSPDGSRRDYTSGWRYRYYLVETGREPAELGWLRSSEGDPVRLAWPIAGTRYWAAVVGAWRVDRPTNDFAIQVFDGPALRASRSIAVYTQQPPLPAELAQRPTTRALGPDDLYRPSPDGHQLRYRTRDGYETFAVLQGVGGG